jgi:hypothetical protein
MAKVPGKTATATGAEPPFSNGGSNMGSSSGGRDFTQENRPQGSAEDGGKSFNSNNSGGRDFTQESRPQSDAKAEVVPNPQEIPSGGKVLKADPGTVSAKVSGTALSPTGQRLPAKNLKSY